MSLETESPAMIAGPEVLFVETEPIVRRPAPDDSNKIVPKRTET